MTVLARASVAAVVLAMTAGTLVGSTARSASAATLVCRTDVVGVTATHRLRSIHVVNGKVTKTLATAAPLPFDPTQMAYKSYTHTGAGLLGILALRADGPPRVIAMKYPSSGTTLTASSRAWEHPNFDPYLVTGLGNLYYAVDHLGKLTKLTDATAKPKPMNGNFTTFRTLQYAMSYRKDGLLWDVLYGTTNSGGLVKADIPVSSASTIPTFTTLRSSGFGGVTGLSIGFCNNDAFHHVIVATKAADKAATWTTVTKVVAASSRNVTTHGAVQPGYNWALHAVF